ncbi:hypothetical protein [Aurantimonas sp. Leaf443]|uniref:hypothetical protein n=1 Tax=Aurantimonas sp. Leaf443 TaxID=1736378 RepID=UPI0007004065|nr:hypothetical protein [Aurantimonas sp. Leaf443]KQT88146.1 hypothetical protein ASG48_01490 [Aurantimonas sp. Leaf443]
MKTGVATSAVLHAAVLSWGLLTFSAPAPLQVETEALPVDLVSIEEFSQSVAGDEKAPVSEKPAPAPTKKPQTLPMPAENVGDNEVDLPTPPTPVARPKPVETAAAAKPSPPPPAPAKVPEPAKPEPVKEAAKPAEPTPPQPDPVEQAIEEAQDVTPEPVAAEPQKEEAEIAAPRNLPKPAPKPQPPKKVEVAEAKPVEEKKPEPKKPEAAKPEPKTSTQTARTETGKADAKDSKSRSDKAEAEESFDAEAIAALLNKEKAAGGGAKRSTETASLGGKTTTGAKLSQNEMDALRGQIQKCWSPPAGVSEAGSLRISIQMRLDPTGALEARPEIVSGGGSAGIERAAGEAARRAVMKCAPYNLPSDKYDTWAEVVVNFDPSQMF